MVQGDSESIKTQKAMLTQYAKEHGFLVAEVYVDDGFSGLNFDRPSFNRMLDDIEAGKIDVVITKDLSRLGRDHLKVGHFTEIYFPMKNVRYIAVNDCVDTANKNNDTAALKNVMNEFYSRDNSRKIRSSIRARAKAGLYRCSFNPIGYVKSPDNHNKLIVDVETAWIVKRIFELANAGMGAHKIATQFRKEQVPCPSWWLHSRGEKDYSKRFENPENKYEWSHTVIRNIISNPLYLGHIVMCKTESIFKLGKSKKVPETEQIRVENTHEPLVSQEIFDGANAKILSRRREDTEHFVSPFAGLVKCGTYAVLAVFVIYFAASLGACFDMSINDEGKVDFDNLANSLESTLMDTDLIFEKVKDGGNALMFPVFTAFGIGLYVLMKITGKKKFHRKGEEHGSARWANKKEIASLLDKPPKKKKGEPKARVCGG